MSWSFNVVQFQAQRGELDSDEESGDEDKSSSEESSEAEEEEEVAEGEVKEVLDIYYLFLTILQ